MSDIIGKNTVQNPSEATFFPWIKMREEESAMP